MVALGAAPQAMEARKRFGVPVLDWYGSNETGGGAVGRLDDVVKPGAVGRPFTAKTMLILDDEYQPCPPGVTGEVAFVCDEIGFEGYLDDEEATEAVVHDGLFLTGDLGYFDEDGYFFFVDRKRDIVRRGGINISSIEIETVLREHPAIFDIAVLPKPDPALGETVFAAVIVRTGATLPSVEALRKFASGKLAPFKIPEHVIALAEFPRTPNGKVQKGELRRSLFDPSAQA
jgi:acyl-coenzyme A synthetase/AMP-(fatty) acid ligase